MKFAGAWENVSDKDINEMHRNVKNLRKRSTRELIKNLKVIGY